jgi:acetyl-CoA acetyltransferase
MTLRDKAAIVGIGATEFSRNSGRSELRLAVDAVKDALHDAGVLPSEVDGICTVDLDNTGEAELARNIGAGDLRFFARAPYGGGSACGAILNAAQAVISGTANVVVCYRAMNERSEYRFGQAVGAWPGMATAEAALHGYHALHGLMTVAAKVGIGVRRYMHETGTTSEDLAHLAVTSRRHAATNPKAYFFGKPISKEDYLASRMIADPLRLLDCCLESDGGVAIVITSTERSRSLRNKPALIRAAAQGIPRGMIPLTNYYRANISVFDEASVVARQLYAASGLGPKDIQGAIVYDHFLPTVLPTLEAYGFCGRGEARHFIRNGNLERGGQLPLNTHGGQVGEAYIHGMNGVAEAVRQIRGTAANQIDAVENMLVTSGTVVPTSGMILSSGI